MKSIFKFFLRECQSDILQNLIKENSAHQQAITNHNLPKMVSQKHKCYQINLNWKINLNPEIYIIFSLLFIKNYLFQFEQMSHYTQKAQKLGHDMKHISHRTEKLKVSCLYNLMLFTNHICLQFSNVLSCNLLLWLIRPGLYGLTGPPQWARANI